MHMNNCVHHRRNMRPNGYSAIVINSKRVAAHRWIWELLYGAIPAGMVVDHTCHNEAAAKGECEGGASCEHRTCINPEHLRMVSQSENIRSGVHSVDVRTECPKGHPYPQSIYVRSNGRRECGACNRERSASNYRERKRAA